MWLVEGGTYLLADPRQVVVVVTGVLRRDHHRGGVTVRRTGSLRRSRHLGRSVVGATRVPFPVFRLTGPETRLRGTDSGAIRVGLLLTVVRGVGTEGHTQRGP